MHKFIVNLIPAVFAAALIGCQPTLEDEVIDEQEMVQLEQEQTNKLSEQQNANLAKQVLKQSQAVAKQEALKTSIPENVTKEELANLKAALATLTENKQASSANSCKVMAYGYKSCGGAAGYLAYSAEQVEEGLLQELVQEYTQYEKQYQLENKMVSTCDVLPQQYPAYGNGQCGMSTEQRF
ncbi:hypothetical protein [Pseudoalteromonas tunicata]|uniref:Uncharacterized protein n=1 Tax=Pseudoalteromonas tunicata D2 TaxID=87626 RepID=A4CAZ1_9GAMM|nr:hypothetical protein [Pseudoalteromonas tunicata]ATC95092.1 hypothetical protein PTUN_a2638 [Pseudoalteromonas tunicata]AXT30727.1 hypothetical protein D1819_07790 [Pseudoalteromonas tunicata]EAR28549.1 hypothetical protein PTD2_22077 [Pseudoalteromonas tunicata D2]MDP4985770.1 hypothetical protein [Pseudoalteromonas tunicata]